MKIGIHTFVTNPEDNDFAWREAIKSYLDFADQVVVVDGCSDDLTNEKLEAWAKREPKLKVVEMDWPKGDYNYSEFANHINVGLETLDTDWKIKMDIDYILHEGTYEDLRAKLKLCPKNRPVATLTKFNVVNRDFGYIKVFVPFCVRKDSGVVYGQAVERENGDWAYPIIPYSENEEGVPIGNSIKSDQLFHTGVYIWNYNYFFRTEEKAREYFWRYVKAWNKVHNKSLGRTEDEAWRKWLAIESIRYELDGFALDLDDHPEIMRKRIEDLTPEQYGYDNWGLFKNKPHVV